MSPGSPKILAGTRTRSVFWYPAHYRAGRDAGVRDGKGITIILGDVTEHVTAELGSGGTGNGSEKKWDVVPEDGKIQWSRSWRASIRSRRFFSRSAKSVISDIIM